MQTVVPTFHSEGDSTKSSGKSPVTLIRDEVSRSADSRSMDTVQGAALG